MKNLLVKTTITLSAILLSSGVASAQPDAVKGTDANYIGGGAAAGITHSDAPGGDATFGGNIQGRFAVPNAPVSVRGAVLFSDDNSAIMPMVSYDIPVSSNANLYVGGGYSFVEAEGVATPLGNRDSVVISAGGEVQLGSNIVVYGDGKWGVDAYENSDGDAVSLQGGVGYRF
ncbi:outer membrane beta-barrel protein [Spirulina sp. CS-785/01]|uniref:outer membrane beta-barrel protein n=1 Tax=Spirulina sp. CS-785/01 TaxID=3021716 RepID=UPI00232C6368|nr:outer membrane beta-barrel protein [Spirulina sp. CS-785/01]MDB9314767.1 outer membrane beta-barrel protein [Spirulina sp. CS-785/01]